MSLRYCSSVTTSAVRLWPSTLPISRWNAAMRVECSAMDWKARATVRWSSPVMSPSAFSAPSTT